MLSEGGSHLVVGFQGEVGSAIFKALKNRYSVHGASRRSKTDFTEGHRFDFMHICIGFGGGFVDVVRQYQNDWLKDGGLTVIHSTVPLGTSRELGAVHSPIRGVHPNLYEGVQSFVKYFGGERAGEAAEVFEALGVKTRTTPKSETTEALKLWDTTYYGWNIIFNKAVREYCERHGLDFDIVYTDANRTYNEGYRFLGKEDVVRPVLRHVKGAIGGHCVIPNCHLLGEDIARFILEYNATLEGEKAPFGVPFPETKEAAQN